LNGSATEPSADRLAELSRQPFLWRTLASKLTTEALIGGRDLGYILNSFWNDPLTPDNAVVIREGGEQEVFAVYMPVGHGKDIAFSVVGPLTFFAQMRVCDIDVPAQVRILGYAPRSSTATFYFTGPSTVLCSSLEIAAESLRFKGEVWLESDDFTSPPRLALFPNGATLGWGGGLVGRYPWNTVETKLPPPYATPARTSLEVLIRECAHRFPSGVAPTVHPNYSPADDDPYLRWVRRQFPGTFPAFIGLLIKHGLAGAEAISASGQGKVRIRFSLKWEELAKALANPGAASPQIRNLLAEAQQLIE
jgi:hypothetical protein